MNNIRKRSMLILPLLCLVFSCTPPSDNSVSSNTFVSSESQPSSIEENKNEKVLNTLSKAKAKFSVQLDNIYGDTPTPLPETSEIYALGKMNAKMAMENRKGDDVIVSSGSMEVGYNKDPLFLTTVSSFSDNSSGTPSERESYSKYFKENDKYYQQHLRDGKSSEIPETDFNSYKSSIASEISGFYKLYAHLCYELFYNSANSVTVKEYEGEEIESKLFTSISLQPLNYQYTKIQISNHSMQYTDENNFELAFDLTQINKIDKTKDSDDDHNSDVKGCKFKFQNGLLSKYSVDKVNNFASKDGDTEYYQKNSMEFTF